MTQPFLKFMYHAFDYFAVIDLAVAIAAAIPVVKWARVKFKTKGSGEPSEKTTSLICIIAYIFVFSVAFIVFVSGVIHQIHYTEVPNIIEKTIGNADLILERHDLRIEVSASQNEVWGNDDLIIRQLPEEGMIVRKGSVVTVELEVKPGESSLEQEPPADGSDLATEPDSSGESQDHTDPDISSTSEPTSESDPFTESLQPQETGPISGPGNNSVDFSVSASISIIAIPLTDKNADITAFTTIEAKQVTVTAKSGIESFGPFDMKTSDYKNWTFPASFYIEGTYNVTVTAYLEDGATATDSLTVTYPFSNDPF